MPNSIDYSLYFILDPAWVPSGIDPADLLQKVIKAGVTLVQIRDKQGSDRERWTRIQKWVSIAHRLNIPIIINDRVDFANLSGADGVHLGRDDLPLEVVRKEFPDWIIGKTVSTPEEAQIAQMQGANYIGAGTVFHTATKKNIQQIIGPPGLMEVKSSVQIPVVGIGGIKAGKVSELISGSFDGVVVLSGLSMAEDPEKVVRNILAEIKSRQ